MEIFFSSTHNFFCTSYLISIFVVFVLLTCFIFYGFKYYFQKQNSLLKNYIKLNYAIPENEQNQLSQEEHDLIKLTYYNTLKNKKIKKIKEDDNKKFCKNKDKRVTFIFS